MMQVPALLHDGHAPMPIQVWVRLAPPALHILAQVARPVEWPLTALRIVDRLPHEMRLAPQYGAERLVVRDPAMMAALDQALRPARQAARWKRLRFAVITAAAVPVLGATLWFGWPPLADAVARALPRSWEQPVGESVTASLTQGRARCTGAEGTAALQRLAERLAAAGGLADVPRLQVLNGPEVNALAAPGGQVLVFQGLIAQASGPDELAGVLAHEFGHVQHRHGFRSVLRAAGLGVFVSVLLGGSDFGTIAVALMALSYTRGFEEEADAFAAAVLRETGYGTEGLASFFSRMEQAHPSGGGVWAYLRTHPHTGDRAARLLQAEGAAPRLPALSSEEWAALRAICRQTEQAPKPAPRR